MQEQQKIFIVGVAGGSGSGKTYLSHKLVNHLSQLSSQMIYQDNYYHDQSAKFDFDGGSVNFDHPDALDFELMRDHLIALKENQSIKMPEYEFSTHTRKKEAVTIEPTKIIIVDGILIFHHQFMRNCFDLKIFVDTSEDLRFNRRLERDVKERGRSKEGVIAQFQNQVKPMHDQFVDPSKEFADMFLNESNHFEQKLKEILERITSEAN
ncbi:uridine kinase [Bacteriovoracaceae bacterium]|nr:uridine kinase [Bacteriovoracaceae bacterium]